MSYRLLQYFLEPTILWYQPEELGYGGNIEALL